MNYSHFQKVSWYPGHMHRAMRLITEKLKHIDIFLEVRDARVPLSSFNKHVDNIIKATHKEKIVIFNKYDLCDKNKTDKVIEDLRSIGILSLAISAKERRYDFSKILKATRAIKKERYSSVGLWMMIGGVPNVGKSNIINNLRVESKKFEHNQVAKSHSKVCLTTYTNGFKISEDPLAYLIDTPGLLYPSIESPQSGLSLGLIGSVKEKIVGKDVLCEFLYYSLGTKGMDIMFKKYNMTTRPTSHIDMVRRTAEAFKYNDDELAQNRLLKDFREGVFGDITLDDVYSKLD